jgi:hypothetical protein
MPKKEEISHMMAMRKAIVAGAVVLTAMLGMPSSAALASSQSVMTNKYPSNCGTTRIGWKICVTASHSHRHIYFVIGWAINNTGATFHDMHIELTGPRGHIKNCRQWATIRNGQSVPGCTWKPNHREPSGNYCTVLWQKFLQGYDFRGKECLGIS